MVNTERALECDVKSSKVHRLRQEEEEPEWEDRLGARDKLERRL